MNNGRVLTLFDLGRFTSGSRFGLMQVLKRNKWGLAVAGSSNRYRRRILPFARIEMRTRLAGWDERFFYILQEMWVNGDCACQALLRTAVTEKGRSVTSDRVIAALGWEEDISLDLPDWVQAWIAAEGQRPWPPEG
jgi:acyl-CoA thioesterase FadM